MSHSLHFETLHRRPGLEIVDVRCRTRAHARSPTEASSRHEIVFPRTGLFVRRAAGGQVVGDSSVALFFTRGEEYAVDHPVDGGDDCTVYAFDDATLIEALSAADHRVADRPERPFARVEVPTSARTVMLQHGLRRSLRASAAGDPLSADDGAHLLLANVVADLSLASGSPPLRATRAATRAANRERVEAVKTLVARGLCGPLSLATLARAVACSPFHLSRIFREGTGAPIHRYVTRLRLRAALDRLASGERDISELALELGFASHSHLTDAFRREFGRPPSSVRRTARSWKRGDAPSR